VVYLPTKQRRGAWVILLPGPLVYPQPGRKACAAVPPRTSEFLGGSMKNVATFGIYHIVHGRSPLLPGPSVRRNGMS